MPSLRTWLYKALGALRPKSSRVLVTRGNEGGVVESVVQIDEESGAITYVSTINGIDMTGGDFLRLDCSNDPLTGDPEISKADPKLTWTDTGASQSWAATVDTTLGQWELVDVTGGTIPVTVAAGALTNTIYVDTAGQVGINRLGYQDRELSVLQTADTSTHGIHLVGVGGGEFEFYIDAASAANFRSSGGMAYTADVGNMLFLATLGNQSFFAGGNIVFKSTTNAKRFRFQDTSGNNIISIDNRTADNTLTMSSTAVTWNEGGANQDHRWETSVNTQALFIDGGNGYVQAGGPTHFSRFEADGTLEFNGDATVWNDALISIVSAKFGAVAPDIITLDSTNIDIAAFAGTGVLVEEVSGALEIPHGYKTATDIVPHVHWCPTTADAGNVKWYMEYWIRAGTGTITTGTASGVGAATTTAWDEVRTDLTTISGTNITIGAQMAVRLYRDPADAADTYAADAGTFTLGIHYERDTIGSRQITTK